MEKTNEALKKLAEERSGGLAKEQPLVIDELKISHDKTVDTARREPWKSFEEKLTGDEHRAYVEIELGHFYFTAGLQARTSPYGAVRGGIGYIEDEYAEHIKNYIAWRKHMNLYSPPVLDACLNVIGHGMTFSEASRAGGGIMTDKTVKKYVLMGISEYVRENLLTRSEKRCKI